MFRTCIFITVFYCCLATLSAAQPSYTSKTPKSCPPHETYTACGASCQTECATLNQPCYIRHIRCPDGCYCDEGYARDANGVCIPQSECSSKQ
ncbi:inducible metalloproteinase inhibitor protein [Ceratitis capitata]|uniref:inducible metalloproteinase inhibitor protein n=1 Tax=Ceratitis capitata TaxID=7213 RepID=UPI000618841B|nr:inducible metalloproteinase inhibitor protein [Ceratitis capitata]